MRRGGADSARDTVRAEDLLRDALASDPPDDETASRILTAAFDQAEDFGLRRFTMDDVARRVGVSRVTIYRYFPKKDQLINALLMRELRRFLTKLEAVIEAESTSEAKLSEGLLFCLAFLREHRVLNRLLRTEPELILPYLTTKADTVVAAARGWIARLIRGEVAAGRIELPEQDIEMLAELLVRTVISLVITPTTVLPVDSPEGQRRLVEVYVKPLVAAVRPRSAVPSVPAATAVAAGVARSVAVVRAAQRRDVELGHREHRLGGTRRLDRVGVADHLDQRGRDDLPGHPVPVLQPATLDLLAALGEPAPVVVHLALVGTADLERDGLAEGEHRATVHPDELLAVELELHGQDRSGRARPGLGVADDTAERGILEDAEVVVRRLFGLVVEPQAGGDRAVAHRSSRYVDVSPPY